jgi:hypothetical protein
VAEHTDLSPKEFREWIEDWQKRELVRIKKTAEAQTKDATEFVAAYLDGKLSRHQARGKWARYIDRWGGDPPFEGGTYLEEMNDTQVKTRRKSTPRATRPELLNYRGFDGSLPSDDLQFFVGMARLSASCAA